MKTKHLTITLAMSLFAGSSFSAQANLLPVPLYAVQSYLDKQLAPLTLEQRVSNVGSQVQKNKNNIINLHWDLHSVRQSTQSLAEAQQKDKQSIESKLEHEKKLYDLKLKDNYNHSKSYTNSSFKTLQEQHTESMQELKNQLSDDMSDINDQLEDKISHLDSHYNREVNNLGSKLTKLDTGYSQKMDQLEEKISKTGQQANSGIASVAAMSNIPYALNSRFSAGIGMGHYKNGKAIAAGAQYQVRENVNLRSSIAWNNSNSPVIGAGMAVGW